MSEILYFANYDDDFTTGDDGTRLRKKLEAVRSRFLAGCGAGLDPTRPVPEAVRKSTTRRRVIKWERQTDVLPETSRANKPGLYLSTDIGLSRSIDYFCLGAVFTVQARVEEGDWRTVFRRSMLKKDSGWQHWDVPLDAVVDGAGDVQLRLITDAYSRAIDRNAPTWEWGYWGQPRVVQVTDDGRRESQYDLIEHIDRSKASVQPDDTGVPRAFDGGGEDSTGATFKAAGSGAGVPEPMQPAIAAFAPHRKGKSGVTVAEFDLRAIARVRPEDEKRPSAFTLPDGVRLIPDLEYARPDGQSLLLDLYGPPRSARPAPDHPLGPRRRLGRPGRPSRPHGLAAHRLRVRRGQYRIIA